MMSNLLTRSPTWVPSPPTRATFNLISIAALEGLPESCDRWGNHSGATLPSASEPSSRISGFGTLYGSECWPISTSLCSRLSAFDIQAQRTITNTKWFDYKTNIEARALTKDNRFNAILPKVAYAGLAIYSDLHSAILPTPSTPPTLGLRDGQDPVEPPRTRWGDVLAKDLKQLGTTLAEASNIAIDRTRWRSTIVVRAVSTPSWQEPCRNE